MTKNSYQGYAEDIETTAHTSLANDEPVSAYTTWVVRDALQHYLDQSGQYRVNWVLASTQNAPSVTDGNPTKTHAVGFPITSIRPDRPMQLDVRVATLMSGGATEIDLVAKIVPFGKPAEVLWSATGSTTTTTATWVIDELAEWTEEQRHKLGKSYFPSVDTDAGSLPTTSSLDIVELHVEMTGTFGGGSGTISLVGMQVREYP